MIIIALILILSIIVLTSSIYRDRITFITIKLNNVEEKINSTLLERKELIKDSEKIIKEVTKTDKEVFNGLNNLDSKNPGMMELDRKLLVYINEFYLIKNKYEKLENNNDFKKIVFKINETEDVLNAYKDYYNDYASKYNKLIRRFPIIIISLIKRRKEKDFFDKKSLSDNDYNDFKY